MKAFQIVDIKDFMKDLLVGDAFDSFRVSEFSVTTNVSYSIDGEIHPEFNSPSEGASIPKNGETYISWSDIKPFCFSIIKGKRTPLNFKIVFGLSKDDIARLLIDNKISLNTDDIFGLYLNCQYENNSLMCVTGTSLRLFSLDKTLDNAWDTYVAEFLDNHGFTHEAI